MNNILKKFITDSTTRVLLIGDGWALYIKINTLYIVTIILGSGSDVPVIRKKYVPPICDRLFIVN